MGSIFHLKREGKPDKDGNPRGCWRYEDKSQGIRDTLNETFANQIKRLREGGVLLPIEKVVDLLLGMTDSGDLKSLITVEKYAEDYLHYQKSVKENRSVDRSHSCLKEFLKLFGNKRLADLKSIHINEYKEKRKRDGLQTNSIRRELALVSGMINHAISEEKFTGQNPVKSAGIEFEDDRRKRVLEPEEEVRLLEVSPEPLRSIILVAVYTGMRANEIVCLEWGWINFRDNEINLPARVVKSKKDRSVPMTPEVKTLILKLKMKSIGNPYVFPSPTKKGHHLLNPKRSWKHVCEKAEISGLRFHDLRRTCGTRLGKLGVPIQVVKEILGHSDIRVTQRYVVSDKAVVQNAISLLRFTYFESSQEQNTDEICE